MQITYYNNEEQLNESLFIIQHLLLNLNKDNYKSLRNILSKAQNELLHSKQDPLLLNILCLELSNAMISNQILLSKKDSLLVKQLYKIVYSNLNIGKS